MAETIYEVRILKVGGLTVKAADPATGADRFLKFRQAERLAESFVNDGLVERASIVEIRAVKELVCAGVHAAKMGLKNINVQGSSIRLGSGISPFAKRGKE